MSVRAGRENAAVKLSKIEFTLWFELIPVWKIETGKRTNVKTFYLSWNEDLGVNRDREGT